MYGSAEWKSMAILKVILSGITAITLVLVGWPLILLYPTMKSEKATGLAAVAGGLTAALHTPQFWLSGLLLFLLFWYVGRLPNKILRVVLFWIPTIFVTVVGCLIFALVTYAYMHRPNG
jgi:hypothetical protein